MVNVLLPPTPLELPPRARRILEHMKTHPNEDGTTSACAENNVLSVRMGIVSGNYLRVRGEYPGAVWCWLMRLELPPRARRILHFKVKTNIFVWNYLRVRGEYVGLSQPNIQ